MKLRIFDGIIDILNQAVDEMREYIEQNQLLQNQMQNYFEEIQTLQTSNIEAMYENKQLKNEIEEKDDLLFRYDEAYKKLNEVYQKNMTKLKQIMEENNKLRKEIKAKESIQHNIINENNILKLEIERKDRILNPLIEEKKRERKFQFLSAWEYGDLQKN